ncbi:MAG TPA: hypothetical protein VH186_22470 [Chloroflexia bacterium]|nr:hypothetical protein [Chloroflexia bacterium]
MADADMRAVQAAAKRLKGSVITPMGRSASSDRISEITEQGLMVESQDKYGNWKEASLVEWQWIKEVLDYYCERNRELTKESLKVRGLKAQRRAPFIFALLVASGKFIETDDRITTLVYRG